MMEIATFERMIRQSGLRLDTTLSHLLRFMVALRVEKQFGTRYWNDSLAFGRDEFEALTPDEAQFHINACKSRLEKVAQSKSCVLTAYPAYLEEQKAKQPQQAQTTPLATKSNTAINYPAH
ncbi:MAG TPA: hypothetical protein VHV10_16685 [Ktedonobacteraceae bacterium]|jgi:hypothetical protein|nr:hypothetical protein [Ktedonobacteraceae bacterium]